MCFIYVLQKATIRPYVRTRTSIGSKDRPELPIERGFPIERVNEIAQKEGRAKQWCRPIYTMHKWWARRPGCLFRAITMYSLLDGDTTVDDVEVYEPGENQTLGNNGLGPKSLVDAIGDIIAEGALGEDDISLDLLRSRDAGYDDLKKTPPSERCL